MCLHTKLREKCKVNTNFDSDTFVGIKYENGDIHINFPLGFDISKDDKGLRKDIFLLLNTIKNTTARKDSEIFNEYSEYDVLGFPMQAYMNVIYDYYKRGYYTEREVLYNVSNRGKIDWGKTIKKQKPYIQNNNVYYLDFVTKKNMMNSDNIISLIHEYCVYESFLKLGWLFTSSMPRKPKIRFNEKMFISSLQDKIHNTYNDTNKCLFMSMLEIVRYLGPDSTQNSFQYGTYRFEYVWEKMIDKVYGIKNKDLFYPKTYWNVGGKEYGNDPLRPDTIMINGNEIYVLDAKYYKYGYTRNIGDLPESTSINKQITYGEYIAEQEALTKKYGKKIYNAFIMPFNFNDEKWEADNHILRIGEAYGDWKKNMKTYEKVQGIVLDTKYLMKISTSENEKEIILLADQISKYVEKREE